jgi:hypothetical protein
MSYELVFWRDGGTAAPPSAPSAPVETYNRLCEGEHVAGLDELPIDDLLRDLLAEFPEAVREPNGRDSEWIVWSGNDGRDIFEVTWSAQHVRFDCRHVDTDDMNRIIDVFLPYDCPLYDPQTDERYDSTS